MKGESPNKVGVQGTSTTWIGVAGESTGSNGVFGQSQTASGVYGYSISDNGVKGESVNSYGVYGRGDSASDFWAHNNTYGGTSSIRWKKNIHKIDDPIEKLTRLRGVYFNWDEAHGGSRSIGFIAEEIGHVLPEIVFYEKNGVDAKGMDYTKITPLLVEAMNAMYELLQYEITLLKEQNKVLENRLSQLENTQ